MCAALAADFATLEGVEVRVMCDRRHAEPDVPGCLVYPVGSAREEREALETLASEADWSVIIAPEFDGYLLDRCRWVEGAGGRVLGPVPRIVALGSNKETTARYLCDRGVPIPRGMVLEPGAPPADFSYPAVLKPIDGAGSQGIRWLDGPPDGSFGGSGPMRLEQFYPGVPASVACLTGPGGILTLVPCRQLLSDDGRMRYLGGSLPLDESLAHRAARLAARAIGALEDPLGYLGVDLVLGADPRGADDVVIEINPRLTTSYVGLRALSGVNLAATMLAVAQGREVVLSWQRGPIQFDATGRVRSGASLVGASRPSIAESR